MHPAVHHSGPTLPLGDVRLSIEERRLSGPAGSVALEPRMVDVLSVIAERPGTLCPREMILRRCWGENAVCDESLNRAVYRLRRALATAGSQVVSIETVPASGYILNVVDTALTKAIRSGRWSWQHGAAEVDHGAIAELRGALAEARQPSPDGLGVLALLLSFAAEYGPDTERLDRVRECRELAAQALQSDPLQADARVALATLAPMLGNWKTIRDQLLGVLTDYPEHAPARDHLAFLEMATGRMSEAARIQAHLFEEFPLAAGLNFRRGYELFLMGDHDAMDRILDNAVCLWPGHPGVWLARVMTLAFTERVEAALDFLEDPMVRPSLPEAALEFHRRGLLGLSSTDALERAEAATFIAEHAGFQTFAPPGILYLCALGETDAALDLCESYFLHRGPLPFRLSHDPAVESAMPDLHRRLTPVLFLPPARVLRPEPRFGELCRRLGLESYWEEAGIVPDFRSGLS